MSRPDILVVAERMMRPDWVPDELPPNVRPHPTATTWVTREGWRVAVKDMTMGHVFNTVAMLRRQAERAIKKRIEKLENIAGNAYAYAGTAPDGASMAAEGYADDCFREIYSLQQPEAVDIVCAQSVRCWPALMKRLKGDDIG